MNTKLIGFGNAILAMENGEKVARSGWNGKDMFIFLGLPKVQVNARVYGHNGSYVTSVDAASSAYGNGSYTYSPTGVICMKTAQDTIVVGWLASQTDMLSKDWYVVEANQEEEMEESQDVIEILTNWKHAGDAVTAAEGKMMTAIQKMIGKQVYYKVGNMKHPALALVIDADFHGSRVLLRNLATQKIRWIEHGRFALTEDNESFSVIRSREKTRRADEQAGEEGDDG